MNAERLLNVTAMKTHALKCSTERRAGKFERVGQSFLDMVEADIDTVIRGLANACLLTDDAKPVQPESTNATFVTGAMADKLNAAMNEVVARIIQRRVHRHPSIGKTLQS